MLKEIGSQPWWVDPYHRWKNAVIAGKEAADEFRGKRPSSPLRPS
ncbi:MAG: hypothetical protein P4L56_20275 [Candidatus Sulfopaludibacter sp.]|nr:hypothetical protein [Candidatus Sulfopaludibacter sp.]